MGNVTCCIDPTGTQILADFGNALTNDANGNVPDSGAIRFADQDITSLPAYRRSALGLARSFQITSLLPDFTACDNVALAGGGLNNAAPGTEVLSSSYLDSLSASSALLCAPARPG